MESPLNQTQQAYYERLTMVEKVAILLMQVGEELTSQIFSAMDADTITEISRYLATMKSVDKAIGVAVLEEFLVIFQSNQYIAKGSIDYAQEILYRALGPEEAKKILDRLTKSLQGGQNFSYLSKIKPQQLSEFIVNEHPQTIALILAHMDPTGAADTLNRFPDELRAEVVMRIANLGDISPAVVKKVSSILENKLESLTSYKVEVGGPRAVADIFNRLGQKTAASTIAYIEQVNDTLATTIKDMMFTFEDIIKLDNKAIQELMKVIDKKDLMLSLKTAPEELKNKLVNNMSQKAAEAMMEEMQFLGAVKLKDVEAAQRRIVEQIQQLAQAGTIQMGDSEETIE